MVDDTVPSADRVFSQRAIDKEYSDAMESAIFSLIVDDATLWSIFRGQDTRWKEYIIRKLSNNYRVWLEPVQDTNHSVIDDALEAKKTLDAIKSFVRILQEGDPDAEDPTKILNQIEEYIKDEFNPRKVLK